jgi:hypothetical protein
MRSAARLATVLAAVDLASSAIGPAAAAPASGGRADMSTWAAPRTTVTTAFGRRGR